MEVGDVVGVLGAVVLHREPQLGAVQVQLQRPGATEGRERKLGLESPRERGVWVRGNEASGGTSREEPGHNEGGGLVLVKWREVGKGVEAQWLTTPVVDSEQPHPPPDLRKFQGWLIRAFLATSRGGQLPEGPPPDLRKHPFCDMQQS